jgi:hypothetical protein
MGNLLAYAGSQLITDYALLKTLGGTPDNHQVVS